MAEVTVKGIVTRGQGHASGWMRADTRLYTDLLQAPIWPGTINVAVEAAQHPSLRDRQCPLLLGNEGVDPRYIRAVRRLVYRDCTLDNIKAYIVRSTYQLGDLDAHFEIVAAQIAYIHPGLIVQLTFDPTGEPAILQAPSR